MTPDTTYSLLLIIATVGYLLASGGYCLYLFIQKESFQKAAFWIVCASLSLHLAAVGLSWIRMGTLPVNNLHQTLVLAALSLAGAFIVLKTRLQLKIIGVFATPLVFGIMLWAILLPHSQPSVNTALNNLWLVAHIILIFAGEAALALACGAGILYLLQEKAIKEKKRGFFFRRLPPLDLLDSTSYSSAVAGFTLLTIGLITGLVYAKTLWGRFWDWDPKEIWSAVTWLIYAALLHGRLALGWQGRKSAIMTIIGFVALIFTFLGVNFLIGGHHQVFTR